MTRSAQKQQEAQAIDLFRRHVGAFPEGAVEPRETPDFLIGGHVGIEVSRLVRNPDLSSSSSALEEAYERAVCDRAAATWSREHPTDAVRVDLFWQRGRSRGPAPSVLAIKLVREVANHLSDTALESRDVGFEDLSDPDLQSHLHSLSVMRMKPTWPSHWGGGFGGHADVFPEELQAEIARKDPKIRRARERIQPVWLLLYAEWTSGSTGGVLADQARGHTYESTADRVFFQEWATGRVDELMIAKP